MINYQIIKQRRKQLGLSQEQVVKEVRRISGGLSHSSYVRIEKGGAERSKFLPYICQVLNLPLSEVDPDISNNIDSDMEAIKHHISTLSPEEQLAIARYVLENVSK